MKNRWSDAARAASAAVRYSKYGPMMGMRPWGDSARAAAAAARAERAALAGGMSPSEAIEVALDARYGEGYLSGEESIDPTLGIGRERASSGYRRVPSISDAAPFEARKASYERAFREWWKGVQATEQNIAAFHAFVAAMGGAAAGAMGAYRQTTGEQPVVGMSRAIGKGVGYVSGETPMYDESGVLAGFAKTGPARYGRTFRPVQKHFSGRKAANLRFDVGRAKIVDPVTGKTTGRVPYSVSDDWPIPKSDMSKVQKAYDMGIRAYSDGAGLEQALRETGIIAGSEEAYMFQKGWQDAPAVMDAAESDGYEPYSIVPSAEDSAPVEPYGGGLQGSGYNYGVAAYREWLGLADALREAGVQPGTDAAYAVEKGYNDATAIVDPDAEDGFGGGGGAETLGEEYAQYLDEVNARRDAEMATRGLDPLGHPLKPAPNWADSLVGGGHDWIASMEAEGRQAFLDGESLDDAFDSRELDPDNDGDMAFVLGYRNAEKEAAGAVREAALKEPYGPRSQRAAEDVFNELALMREPAYDKARFGGRDKQYKAAREAQKLFNSLGPREGGEGLRDSAQGNLSRAFEAIVRGEDAKPFLNQAEADLYDLSGLPVKEVPKGYPADRGSVSPHTMDLPGGGGFEDPSFTLPEGGVSDVITPEQRDAARALGVLKGQWGVNSMVERMVPPQFLDDYEAGVAEGKNQGKDTSLVPPADRAAVVRAARAYLDGRIGDEDESGVDFPDHLNDRWNLSDYETADAWASRNKDGVVKGSAAAGGDERGQYADAALVKAGLDWLGSAVAEGDTPAADAAVAYLADLLGTVRAGKDKPGARVADGDDGEDGETADDRVEFDEEGDEVEGERFFEDSYADPDMPMPWESGDAGSFRRWFPGVRNRSAVAERVLAVDKYRERGLRNTWSDAARVASAAARLAKYGPMMGLKPWGDAARAEAAAARAEKGGGSETAPGELDVPSGGGTQWAGGSRDFDERTGTYRSGSSKGGSSSGGGSRRTAPKPYTKPRGGDLGTMPGFSDPRDGGMQQIPEPWLREADFTEAVEAYGEGGVEGMSYEQMTALFEDIKERSDAGEKLTKADKKFLEELDSYLGKEVGDEALAAADKDVGAPGLNPAKDPALATPADDAKALRKEGVAKFREETGREPVTSDDYDRVDMLGGVPKDAWWDVALHDENAPADAGIGRARAKEIEAAAQKAREKKADGLSGLPKHWSDAAKERYRERQDEAAKKAKKEARAKELQQERDERRAAREALYTAGWLEDGKMPKAASGARDGLPPSWDRRVPASSSGTGFRVPRKESTTYLGGGRYMDSGGRVFRKKGAAYTESSDGAVFFNGRWYDKKTGRTLKAGARS